MILACRVLVLTALVLVVAPRPAAADGAVTVGARAVAHGYQVRGSDGVTVPRRRISQLLALRSWAGPRASEPVITGVFDLRIESDLGLEPPVLARLDDDAVAFGAPDLRLAYVQVHDVGGVLDLTAGRHLYIGPDATERIDGGVLRLRSPTGLFASVRAGALVVPSSALSQDPAFGGFFGDRDSALGERHPAVSGGSVGFVGDEIQVTFAIRRLTAGPDPARGGDTLDDRAAIALRAAPTAGSELLLDGAWDIARRRVARAAADVVVAVTPSVDVGVGADLWRPDFWLGSVWDVFGARPYTSGRATGSVRFSPGVGELVLRATADARSYGASDAAVPWFDGDTDGRSFGGRAQAHWRWDRGPAAYLTNLRADLWTRAEDGVGGLIVFAGAGVGADVVNERLGAGLRGFAIRSEPDLQPFQAGTSGAVALDLESRLGPYGRLQLTFEGLSNAPYLYELRAFLSYEVRYDVVEPKPHPSRFVVPGAP